MEEGKRGGAKRRAAGAGAAHEVPLHPTGGRDPVDEAGLRGLCLGSTAALGGAEGPGLLGSP